MSEKLTSPILVITDHTGSDSEGYTLTEPSKRLLTMARALTSGGVWAIALNPAPDVAALSTYGATRILSPKMGRFSPRIPAVVADCVVAAVNHDAPGAILGVSNARGRDVAAQVAVLLGSGASVEVSRLEVCDGELVSHKSVLGGTWETQFHMTRGIPVVAARTSGLEATRIEAAEVEVETYPVSFRASTKAITVMSSREVGGTVSLADAPVVVCGGRGVAGEFSLVNELANELGGAVGATRVATEEGWIDRSAQVGQSGVSIAPNLYIGLGISGDIHHVSGLRGAKTIVAVCDDSEAPIFELADFGVVGDLTTVVPQALKHLREQ